MGKDGIGWSLTRTTAPKPIAQLALNQRGPARGPAGSPALPTRNGEAGDQYSGLDRFGRIVDQRWRKSDGTHTDRFLYGYDRNGNRMYRDNAQGDSGAATFDELYHQSGSQYGTTT